jgi:hypothetical protein
MVRRPGVTHAHHQNMILLRREVAMTELNQTGIKTNVYFEYN